VQRSEETGSWNGNNERKTKADGWTQPLLVHPGTILVLGSHAWAENAVHGLRILYRGEAGARKETANKRRGTAPTPGELQLPAICKYVHEVF